MKHTVLFCSLLLTLNAGPAFSKKPTQAQIQYTVNHYVNSIQGGKKYLQGGAIAILDHDKVVYKATFGNQKGKRFPITSKTLFPLASVSKPVTATAIALMVDNGTLDLDQEYHIPCINHKVNLKHILSHSTGYRFSGNSLIEQGMDRKKILNELHNQRPKCLPGQCHYYSNTTFGLVEEVLNSKHLSLKIAIAKLRTLLHTDEIQLVPFSNPSMPVAFPHVVRKNKKTKHTSLVPLPFPPYYPKSAAAAAGIFASLDAMIELYKLQFGYRPDLISQTTLDRFYTPFVVNPKKKWSRSWPSAKEIETYYGLGWRVLKDKNHPNRDYIYHSGLIGGAVSFVGYIPSLEVGIIILVNQQTSFAVQKGLDFWGDFLRA